MRPHVGEAAVHRSILLLVCLALGACATPSQRIATKLTELGVPQPQARCMGDRLQDRLSISQLKRLQDISRIDSDRLGRMRIGEIADKLTDPRDPALVAEVIRAGIGCAI